MRITATYKETIQHLVYPITVEDFYKAAQQIVQPATETEPLMVSLKRVDVSGRTVEEEFDNLQKMQTSLMANKTSWKNALRVTAVVSKPSDLSVGSGITTNTIECNRSGFWARRRLIIEMNTQATAKGLPLE